MINKFQLSPNSPVSLLILCIKQSKSKRISGTIPHILYQPTLIGLNADRNQYIFASAVCLPHFRENTAIQSGQLLL